MVSSYLCTYFQSTLPREERLIVHFADPISGFFSIHAPTRGATDIDDLMQYSNIFFNPRSHERSDYAPYLKIDYMSIFQSTLPREERLYIVYVILYLLNFSIHAPTRGATQTAANAGAMIFSIHAPTRGATGGNNWAGKLYCLFNPRSHERSDRTKGVMI